LTLASLHCVDSLEESTFLLTLFFTKSALKHFYTGVNKTFPVVNRKPAGENGSAAAVRQ
jgi:hypothetical protein